VSGGEKGVHSKEETMGVQIGDSAPEFSADALHCGAVRNIRLAEYRNQWVVLLFYPADFTLV